MTTWLREQAGRYVRSDGAQVERDFNAGVHDYPWLVFGPQDRHAEMFANTLREAKQLADEHWPPAALPGTDKEPAE